MIKLDIISGFLGAGKTTFIKKILQAYENVEEKIVVIINEFGSIGIDGDLIRRDGYEFIEISKGCLCCSLKDDFVSALEKVAVEQSPDRVIIEPSGIFVVEEAVELLKQERLSDKYKMNHVITIVDVLHFHKHYHKIGLFLEKQIQAASKLIVSKVQLAEPEDVERTLQQLRKINPQAEVFSDSWENYDRKVILEILASDEEDLNMDEERTLESGSSKGKHPYDSYSIKTGIVFDRASVNRLLEKIAEGQFGKVIRSKGILLGTPEHIEFQYVEGRYDMDVFQGGLAKGKMIFIGEDIKKLALSKELLIIRR
ncbi:MAG: CobW family GTP-binding protein [Bacillota bacterium]